MKEPSKHTDPEKIPPIMWLVLVLVIVAVAAYSIPAALRAYRSSGLKELIQEHQDSTAAAGSEHAPQYQGAVFFLSPEPNGTMALADVSTSIDSQQGLNDLLERLLRGPSFDELELGYISLIPDGTKLIGTSIADRAAYIELSSHLTNEGLFGRDGTEYACKQIVQTANSLPFIREALIIVDGTVFYQSSSPGL
ncbi:MAG: GerMN domain-containing protein [Spirochaetota bacterium]